MPTRQASGSWLGRKADMALSQLVRPGTGCDMLRRVSPLRDDVADVPPCFCFHLTPASSPKRYSIIPMLKGPGTKQVWNG
jgi:hypothetical protein